MTLLETKRSEETKKNNDSHLKLLFPDVKPLTREEIIYRRNGKSVDKVVEFDIRTGSKVKTTHYDYFNDKKIRSVDEFDKNTGKKIRTINYVLYKSIDEFDTTTGKKLRTINFNVKDDSKISSIQEYDLQTGKISTVSIYKRDGKTVSVIKKIDPETEKVTNTINKSNTRKYIEKQNLPTRTYDNIAPVKKEDQEHIARLIDNLYRRNLKFENI